MVIYSKNDSACYLLNKCQLRQILIGCLASHVIVSYLLVVLPENQDIQGILIAFSMSVCQC